MLNQEGKEKQKKEREKAHKLDCQDSSSRFSVSCWLRVPSKLHQAAKGKKIQDTFDLWILCRDQSRDPLSLKKTLLMLFQMQIKVKKSDVNRANIFCRKKLKPRREHDLRKHIFFNGRLSVLLVARLIKASRIFVALQKSNRPWETKESFLAFWLSS